jgi:hypothetical protein
MSTCLLHIQKSLARFFILASLFSLTACGTLTGIPSHGGGKRFATEQRLVSASIRSSLKELDISGLKGMRAALVFDLVADEGGGNLSGGRWSPGLLFSVGSAMSPVSSTVNAFQVYNLAEGGTNYSNTHSGGTSTTTGTTLQTGTSTTVGSSQTNETSSSNTSSNGSSSGTSTSTSTTGGTTTTTDFSQTDSNNSSTSGTSSSTTTSTSTTDSSGRTDANSNTAHAGNSSTAGGQTYHREAITPAAVSSITSTQGTRRENMASLQYRGLGEYHNFPVPKSDASLLMGLVRNYFLLSGVVPTTPNDPSADVLVYVTVDVFGIVRSRFDAMLYNNETVKAETSFEIMAFEREGKNVLRPQQASKEAQYQEHYLMWVGPLETKETVRNGQGLLVNFKDVGLQTSAAADAVTE